MKVRFHIEKGRSTIMATLSGECFPAPRHELKIVVFGKGSGYRVSREEWDKDKEVPHIGVANRKEIVAALADVEEKLYAAMKAAIKSGSTLNRLQAQAAARGEVVNKKDFFGLSVLFLQHTKKTKSENTYLSIVETLNKVRAFGDQYNITFDTLNMHFVDLFRDFCNNDGIQDKTVETHLTRIRSFLKWCQDRGYPSTHLPGFKAKSKPNELIHLTKEEYKLFCNAQVSRTRPQAQDLFIFCCEMGCRFSDAVRLDQSNFKPYLNGFVLDYINKKTGVRVIPPLSEKALQIIDKYKGGESLLPQIDPKSAAGKIQKIAEIAGIDTPTKHYKRIAGELQEFESPKYEVVRFHSSRHTFVMHRVQAGWDASEIAKYTGHEYPYTGLNAYAKNIPAIIPFDTRVSDVGLNEDVG